MIVAEEESEGMRSKGKEESFIHLFSQPVFIEHLLWPDTVLDPGESRVNRKDTIPCPHGYSLKIEDRKQ